MDDEEVPPTRLVLVRHGESLASVNRSIGGPRTCSGLSDLGRRQSERLAARLAETGELTDVVLFASAYPRAIETAQLIAPALGGITVHVDARWGEHDPGPDCDGLTFEEFIERHGMPDWEADPHAVTFPGGETLAELHHRVGQAVRDAVTDHVGRTVLVCCHGGVVNAVLRTALRTPSTGGFELFTTNASLTELLLVRPGRWRLVRYNDAAHLAGL
jgi:broad specificity phosphatase PhoE